MLVCTTISTCSSLTPRRVEAFHYTYTVSIPALIIGFILSGSTPTFLRRSIIYGGPHMDSLLAQQFRLLLREEHEKRMSDEQGSRRGVDIGNLLAGLVPGTMSSGSGGGAAVGDGRASSRIAAGGGFEGSGIDGTATPPFSGTNGSYYAQQASYTGYPAPLDGSQPAPHLSTSANHRPPSASSASSIQHPHQRHLWDPARTGYGNGICFYDLALLHGRSGDDHGPCMCDLTACRTCFHELLYFRGRRDVVPPPVAPSMAMMDGLHAPTHGMGMTTTMPPPPPSVHVPHDVDAVEASLTQAGAGPEPPQYTREQDVDGMSDPLDGHEDGEYEVEVNGRPGMYDGIPTPQGSEHAHHHLGYQQQQQQHFTQTSASSASGAFPHVQYTSQPSAAPKRPSPLQIRHPEMSDILLVEEHLRTRLHYMASPDVILRYGDEDEFIPPEELVMPPSPPIQDVSLASSTETPPPLQPKQQVKVIQGRKMKGGKMKGGQQKLTVAMKTVPSPTASPSTTTPPEKSLQEREKERAQQQEVRTRLNGSQLPRSWTDESASSRNMAVILTFRHLVKVSWPVVVEERR